MEEMEEQVASNGGSLLLLFLAFTGFVSTKIFGRSAGRVVNSLLVFVFWFGSMNFLKAAGKGEDTLLFLAVGVVLAVLGAKLLED